MLEFVAQIKIPMQFHFGTRDDGIPLSDVRKLKETVKAGKLPAEIYTYKDAEHGFANLTGLNYKPDAAMLAEKRWKKFLRKHL